jgi:hypothetical protein
MLHLLELLQVMYLTFESQNSNITSNFNGSEGKVARSNRSRTEKLVSGYSVTRVILYSFSHCFILYK